MPPEGDFSQERLRAQRAEILLDPIQGVNAYKNALAKAGNQNFRVELIPDADHNIILCKTGSMKERSRRSAKEWQNYAPEYLEIMETWLGELSKN